MINDRLKELNFPSENHLHSKSISLTLRCERLPLQQLRYWQDDETTSSRVNNAEEDGLSMTSQLRKTKSMDASCLDVRSINDVSSALKPLSRAKSEYNLNSSTHSLVQGKAP